MKLYIKSMKCARCKLLVKTELQKLGFQSILINSGEVEIREEVPEDRIRELDSTLKELGMGFMNDRNEILVDTILRTIAEVAGSPVEGIKMNFSDEMTRRLGYTYKYLNKKFTAAMGSSMKRYFILKKMENVREMLRYTDLSISQIAFQMDFSGVSHLSGQFRKETGMTPSQFRRKERIGN